MPAERIELWRDEVYWPVMLAGQEDPIAIEQRAANDLGGRKALDFYVLEKSE